jgi:hypothetical protein
MSAQELTKTVLKDNTNLKAYYRFESGALTTDSSGQSKTLTNNNTATETTGKYGGGVATNGSNQSLTISDTFSIGTTNWSVSVWAKSANTSQAAGVVAVGAGATGFSIYQGNGGGAAGNKIDGHIHGVAWIPSGVNWTGTDYDHIVLVQDGSAARIYVNGKYCANVATACTAPATQTQIGKLDTSYWSGSIDEVAIFSTALSADQIKELYEGRFIGETYPQSGLVGGWHLNGGSTDFSGNNNHGTDTAITYSQANGKFGQGGGFNGSSSSIAVAYSATTAMTASYTASLWFNATALPSAGNSANLIGNYTGATTKGYELRFNEFTAGVGSIRSLHGDASTFPQVSANCTITTGVWYHLASTFNGSVMKVYLNGNEIGTNNTSTAVPTHSNILRIGSLEGSSRYFSGKLDEVVIYSVAKSAQEIRRMYAVGTGRLS